VSFSTSREGYTCRAVFLRLRLTWVRVEYVSKYATKENVDEAGNDSDDSDEMSSVGSFDEEEEDEEPAGTMDEV